MQGRIEQIKHFDNRPPFGFIKGEDNNSYYFNAKSISDGYSLKELSEGETVSFTEGPAFEGASNPRAQNVKPMNSSSHFYDHGYSINLDRDKLINYTLKPNSGEIEVLDKLSDLLYISYASKHDMGHNSVFPFCLIGNTRALSQFVQGHYEFLLVFSHFSKGDWQSNTLKAAQFIRLRKEIVDRNPLVNFYILISNARNLTEEINKVKGGTGAAIIPFSFSEILSCESKEELHALLLSRFDEYYFENNMLGEKETIEEDKLLFGDRVKIAHEIVKRCMDGKNSGIFGLRRSGKSSVLKAVLRRLEYNGIKYAHIESRSFLANKDIDSCNTALFNLAKEIRRAVLGYKRNEGETRAEFTARLRLQSTRDDYQENAVQYFIEDVKYYTKDEPVFVIAFDEIETITYNTTTSKTWKSLDTYHDFWTALRETGCPLIVCGVNSTINERNSIPTMNDNGETVYYDNPMHERIHLCADFSKTYLPAFTDEQTKQMLNTLGGYSNVGFNNVFSPINQAFGGQPYPIRQFCAFMFDKNKDKRKPHELYEFTRATFEANLSDYFDPKTGPGNALFETILEHIRIYKEEYDKLKQIALAPDKYRSVAEDDSHLIDHLEKYGIIEYDRSTNYVAFRISKLQDYIQYVEHKDPADMNDEERREYVQKKVAECEKKLKRLILNRYNFDQENGRKLLLKGYDPKKGEGKYLSINPKANPKADPLTCNYSDLFRHSLFRIYFSSLANIISDNWNSFGSVFKEFGITMSKFKSCMEEMNAGRTDADHYDAEDMEPPEGEWEISNETMDDFVRAYETIEKVLKRYAS